MLDALTAFSRDEYFWLGGAVALVLFIHYSLQQPKQLPPRFQALAPLISFGTGMALLFLSVFLVAGFFPFAAIVLFIVGAGLICLDLPIGGQSEAGWVRWLVLPAMLFGFSLMGYFFLVTPYLDNKLLSEGSPALATIVSIAPTGNLVNDQPEVKLVLEVRPESGAGYRAEKRMVISPVYLPQFQPGAELKVKYDPKKPTRLAVEAVRTGGR